MEESEIQELADSPREIGTTSEKSRLWQAINVACILVLLWLARGWILQATQWFNGNFQKEIARKLGISSWAIGSLYYVVHTGWTIYISNNKKKQKRAEEEKKQFSPHYNPVEEKKQFSPKYNPIADRDSESWSHERDND